MWTVRGTGLTTQKPYTYEVPGDSDAKKLDILMVALQEHGAKNPDDKLKPGVEAAWVSDKVTMLADHIVIPDAGNVFYQVEKYNPGNKTWDKHSRRGSKGTGAASESATKAAEANPGVAFRIVEVRTTVSVVGEAFNKVEGVQHVAKPAEDKPAEDGAVDPKPADQTTPDYTDAMAKAKAELSAPADPKPTNAPKPVANVGQKR
jgi:hypothetical protein